MNKRSLFVTGMIAILLIGIAFWYTHSPEKAPQISYQVRLNGQNWFYVRDKSKLERLLQEYKNQYTAQLEKNVQVKSIGFKQKLEIVKIANYSGNAVSEQEVRKKIYAKQKTATHIEVKDGDNIWSIAQQQNVSVEELQKLNPQLNQEMLIYPGDKLIIKPEKPVLDVVIVYENTVVEDIPYTTEYINDVSLYASQREIVSAGINGKQEAVYKIVLENGNEVERQVIHTRVIESPIVSKVRVGTKIAVSRSGSSFGIVSGGRITSSFGNRIHPVTGKNIFHKGIDIGASQGSPIYAYANGVITFAGWKSGYGNFVAINHGNGMVTRYAHMSAIYVKVGQQVSAAQRIGAVGSTGVSTGPHLHFEVLINGEYKNPQNYL